jgi:hypothetical protein
MMVTVGNRITVGGLVSGNYPIPTHGLTDSYPTLGELPYLTGYLSLLDRITIPYWLPIVTCLSVVVAAYLDVDLPTVT